jgi:putative GTP pyrophosphokinase
MDKTTAILSAVKEFDDKRHEFAIFMEGVAKWFQTHPMLSASGLPTVHSVKMRLKDADHLKEKIERKWDDSDPISGANIFTKITDLAGVRVLHVHQEQFVKIHRAVSSLKCNGTG